MSRWWLKNSVLSKGLCSYHWCWLWGEPAFLSATSSLLPIQILVLFSISLVGLSSLGIWPFELPECWSQFVPWQFFFLPKWDLKLLINGISFNECTLGLMNYQLVGWGTYTYFSTFIETTPPSVFYIGLFQFPLVFLLVPITVIILLGCQLDTC